MAKDRFEVTVTRVNEGVRDPPYLTVTAYGLIIAPDASLSITGIGGSQSITAATWDRLEIKKIARPHAQTETSGSVAVIGAGPALPEAV